MLHDQSTCVQGFAPCLYIQHVHVRVRVRVRVRELFLTAQHLQHAASPCWHVAAADMLCSAQTSILCIKDDSIL